MIRAFRATLRPVVAAWLAVVPLAAGGQTVTVAKSFAANESTIQAAIDSLAPGGSRDDGNQNNNSVQILDDAVYREALNIQNMGVTLAGVGFNRPRIITSAADAAGNPGSFAIRVDTDHVVTLRNLVILPDAADPPPGCITFDEFSSTGRYTVELDSVLVAGNDGSDNPASADGKAAPLPGHTAYGGSAVDFNSTPTGAAPSVTLRRTVVTAASSAGGELVRFFSDNGTIRIQEGCVFSYSADEGVRFPDAINTTASWIGTAAEPIILHGNGGAAIFSTHGTTRAVSVMEHVAVTRNSLAIAESAVVDNYSGALANAWRHVTIAGTSGREGSSPTDGPLEIGSPLELENVILAGDGGEGPVSARNLVKVSNGATVSVDGVCVDVSHGGTTLNVRWLKDNGEAVDGITGAALAVGGPGWTPLSPDFISLDPSSADYLRVTNAAFRVLGPSGGALTGAGRFEPLPFTGMLQGSGDVQGVLEAVEVPSSGDSRKFRQPTADELLVFRNVVSNIMEGELQAASDLAALVNYDLTVFNDTPRSRFVAVLDERATNRSWGGVSAYVLEPRRKLVIGSPHPLFDGTRVQGIDLFVNTEALAFMQAGTHRNNSPELTPCDGTFTSGEPYRISDVAHNDLCFFQAAHEQVHHFFEDTVSVSVHGMSATTDPSDVVISNGTGTQTTGASLSRDVAGRMNQILTAASDARYAVSHQEPGEEPALSGGTNTQGRYCNGSHNPCTFSVPALFPERFLHMEQSPTVRNPPASNWDFVTQTYNDLVPAFAAEAPAAAEDGSLLAGFPLDGDASSTTGQEGGTLAGGTGAGTDRFGGAGRALLFAPGSHVSVPDFPYTGADREFTLSFWFRAETSGTSGFRYLLSHGSTGRGGQVTLPDSLHVYLTQPAGNLRVRFNLSEGTQMSHDGSTGLADGQWHFFALTYSQTAGTTIFVDGAQVWTAPGHRLKGFDPEGPMVLGARSDLDADRFLAVLAGESGGVDSLRIHNAALSASQILDLFQEPNGNPVVETDSWVAW